jgi:thiamine biosynthesis protein ThiC
MENFAKVKEFIQQLNTRFDIGPEKTRVALMQFGKPSKTKIEFNLGKTKTLQEVNKGVEKMKYLNSGTATGDALRRSREEVRFSRQLLQHYFMYLRSCIRHVSVL